jgi:hypothetical protein
MEFSLLIEFEVRGTSSAHFAGWATVPPAGRRG